MPLSAGLIIPSPFEKVKRFFRLFQRNFKKVSPPRPQGTEWETTVPENTLLRAEDPVAGVAQAGDDVAVLVELFIHGGDVDLHVGVVGADALDALGGGEDVHELDVLARRIP